MPTQLALVVLGLAAAWAARRLIHKRQDKISDALSTSATVFDIAVTSEPADSHTSTSHGQRSIKAILLPLSCRSAEQVLSADVAGLQQARVVGLDCEWQPERQGSGSSQRSRVALLQLATADACYLAQVLHMDGVPAQLRRLLADPLVVKVGL